MADQNKDETKPILSGLQPGPGENLLDTTSQSDSMSGVSGNTRSATGASSADGVSGMAAKAKESVKASSARFADEAKQYASDMADIAKEKSRTLFQQQKETAVGQVDSVAHAFRSTAQNLQGEGQGQVGRYIEMAADRLESFGGQLRGKDLDTLIDDAQNLARRSPGIFFAGTIAAGFLLSRFLKSSSQRRQDAMLNDEWRTPGNLQTGTQSSTYTSSMSVGASAPAATGMAGASVTSDAIVDSGLDPNAIALGTGNTLGTSSGAITTEAGSLPSTLGGSEIGGVTHGNR